MQLVGKDASAYEAAAQRLQETVSAYSTTLTTAANSFEAAISASPAPSAADASALRSAAYEAHIYIGDLRRYQAQFPVASAAKQSLSERWSPCIAAYVKAGALRAGNGHHHNQLGVIARLAGCDAQQAYRFIRALCCKEPFPGITDVLTTFFDDDNRVLVDVLARDPRTSALASVSTRHLVAGTRLVLQAKQPQQAGAAASAVATDATGAGKEAKSKEPKESLRGKPGPGGKRGVPGTMSVVDKEGKACVAPGGDVAAVTPACMDAETTLGARLAFLHTSVSAPRALLSWTLTRSVRLAGMVHLGAGLEKLPQLLREVVRDSRRLIKAAGSATNSSAVQLSPHWLTCMVSMAIFAVETAAPQAHQHHHAGAPTAATTSSTTAAGSPAKEKQQKGKGSGKEKKDEGKGNGKAEAKQIVAAAAAVTAPPAAAVVNEETARRYAVRRSYALLVLLHLAGMLAQAARDVVDGASRKAAGPRKAKGKKQQHGSGNTAAGDSAKTKDAAPAASDAAAVAPVASSLQPASAAASDAASSAEAVPAAAAGVVDGGADGDDGSDSDSDEAEEEEKGDGAAPSSSAPTKVTLTASQRQQLSSLLAPLSIACDYLTLHPEHLDGSLVTGKLLTMLASAEAKGEQQQQQAGGGRGKPKAEQGPAGDSDDASAWSSVTDLTFLSAYARERFLEGVAQAVNRMAAASITASATSSTSSSSSASSSSGALLPEEAQLQGFLPLAKTPYYQGSGSSSSSTLEAMVAAEVAAMTGTTAASSNAAGAGDERAAALQARADKVLSTAALLVARGACALTSATHGSDANSTYLVAVTAEARGEAKAAREAAKKAVAEAAAAAKVAAAEARRSRPTSSAGAGQQGRGGHQGHGAGRSAGHSAGVAGPPGAGASGPSAGRGGSHQARGGLHAQPARASAAGRTVWSPPPVPVAEPAPTAAAGAKRLLVPADASAPSASGAAAWSPLAAAGQQQASSAAVGGDVIMGAQQQQQQQQQQAHQLQQLLLQQSQALYLQQAQASLGGWGSNSSWANALGQAGHPQSTSAGLDFAAAASGYARLPLSSAAMPGQGLGLSMQQSHSLNVNTAVNAAQAAAASSMAMGLGGLMAGAGNWSQLNQQMNLGQAMGQMMQAGMGQLSPAHMQAAAAAFASAASGMQQQQQHGTAGRQL